LKQIVENNKRNSNQKSQRVRTFFQWIHSTIQLSVTHCSKSIIRKNYCNR